MPSGIIRPLAKPPVLSGGQRRCPSDGDRFPLRMTLGMKIFRWFLPGLRIKRWILVILIACAFAVIGAMSFMLYWQGIDADYGVSGKSLLLVGATSAILAAFGLITGFYRLLKSLGELLERKDSGRGLVDIAYERRFLGGGPRVVALGGGTGMSALLSGLKHHTSEITAIVSMADDGGSTGKLRASLGVVPMGDIRKCLVALADEEPMMRHLMNYRFADDELDGHSFGNLLLTVLERVTGSFKEGVKEANRILQVRGKVLPSAVEKLYLVAEHPDGTKTTGQRHICKTDKRIKRLELKPAPAPAEEDVLSAIRNAELIILGPGSAFTSVMPNLLIKGIPETISASDAIKVLVANVANSEGETRGFTLTDHIQAFIDHTAPFRVFDYVLAAKPFNADLLEQIRAKDAEPVLRGDGPLPKDIELIYADVVDENEPTHHSPKKLSQALMDLLSE
ncbi:MAG: gluconeogenesis factor YvcK family protein [Planctomycetota bacterium]